MRLVLLPADRPLFFAKPGDQTMPIFQIDQTAQSAFPELEVHAVRCHNAGNIVSAALAEQALAEALDRRAAGASPDLDNQTKIQRWRDAYRAMGAKPSKYQSSIEALYRRAAKGGSIRHELPLVAFYNANSLWTFAPVGAYDVTKLSPSQLLLRRCRPGTDRFQPLGAAPEGIPLLPALLVYASSDEVLCWGFNHRDSKVTALDATSEDVVFFSEAAYSSQAEGAAAVIKKIRIRLMEIGGECSEHLIAKSSISSFEF
jgi:DNA/RNA-binding domain of Phe-tRNA-synthetase-like protein